MRPFFAVKVAENARIFAMTLRQTGLERVDCLAIGHPSDDFSGAASSSPTFKAQLGERQAITDRIPC
jgi:hypothetical protein